MGLSLGETIREARKGAGLTLRDLAARAEVSYSYLSKIENDKPGFTPSEARITAIAEALKLDPGNKQAQMNLMILSRMLGG